MNVAWIKYFKTCLCEIQKKNSLDLLTSVELFSLIDLHGCLVEVLLKHIAVFRFTVDSKTFTFHGKTRISFGS
jgi:hypothetical protein